MRTFITICAGVMLAMITLACGDDSDGPEVVTQKFLTHFYKKEFKEAKQYVSQNSIKEIEFFEKIAKSKLYKPETPVIETMECITEDDTAVCTCTVNGIEEKVRLVREEDKWLINNPKEIQQRRSERDPKNVEENQVENGGDQEHDH